GGDEVGGNGMEGGGGGGRGEAGGIALGQVRDVSPQIENGVVERTAVAGVPVKVNQRGRQVGRRSQSTRYVQAGKQAAIKLDGLAQQPDIVVGLRALVHDRRQVERRGDRVVTAAQRQPARLPERLVGG